MVVNCLIVQKLSRLSRNFRDLLETFKIVQNLSRWKLSRLSTNLSDFPKIFQTILKLSRLMLCSDLILSQFCRYAQKLSGRAKTFRLAMPTRQRGFSDSGSTYTRVTSTIIPAIVVTVDKALNVTRTAESEKPGISFCNLFKSIIQVVEPSISECTKYCYLSERRTNMWLDSA